MQLREYRQDDCAKIMALFYQTVHQINAKDYDKSQLDAWAPADADKSAWGISLQKNYLLVAVEDGQIIGFGDIDSTGYLDRLFVHAQWQGGGVATALCNALEAKICTGMITTHASITAKPFFEKRGYRVLKQQQVQKRGVILTNYVMQKAV